MKPNWFLPLAALVFGFVFGIAGTGISGVIVRDSAKTSYNVAPDCPTNYLPDFWGTAYVGGEWVPIYRCEPNPDGKTAPDTIDPGTWRYPSNSTASATSNATVKS